MHAIIDVLRAWLLALLGLLFLLAIAPVVLAKAIIWLAGDIAHTIWHRAHPTG